MTMRSLAILGSATALAVVLAVATSFSWNTRDAVSERGSALLPGVAKQVGDIAQISIDTADQKITIRRDGDNFTDAASGYPVKRDAVRNLVTSVALLSIEEKKTADATRHGELDLAVPGSADGAGEKVSFATKEGSEIAALIAGKSDYTVGGLTGGQYVRKASEAQTYLVRGSVKLPYGRSGWFDTKLLEVKPETVVGAKISTGADNKVSLTKVGDKLKLVDLPEGKIEDEDKIGRITKLFSSLSFADVRKSTGAAKPDAQTLLIVSAEGVTFKLVSMGATDDKSHWVQVQATADKTETEQGLADILKKVEGFEFKLTGNNGEVFAWTLADVTKDPQS